MNKSMLYAGLMTFLSAAVCADDGINNAQVATNSQIQKVSTLTSMPNQQFATGETNKFDTTATNQAIVAGCQRILAEAGKTVAVNDTAVTKMPTATQAAAAMATSALDATIELAAADPATTTATPAATTAPAPAATTVPDTTNTSTTGASPAASSPAAAPTPKTMDCKYRIPAETHVDQALVLKWAEKAAQQSFDFDHNDLEKQLSALKTCYTDQGWQGFNDALQKSGNLSAIKSQQLMVSSMVTGEGKIVEIKENQWKVTLPMQVVYQNNKEKLTQPLTVNLVVGRKVSGDLGIMQMIAIPSHNNTPDSSSASSSTTQ